MGEIIKMLTVATLTQTDKQRASQLVVWFKLWKKRGNVLPIKTKDLCIKLKDTVGWEYNKHSFPALTNYIRNVLHEWVIASGEGLDYAETVQEKNDFKDYLEKKIAGQAETLQWVKKKMSEEAQANQQEMTYEAPIYGEPVVEAIKNRLGARKVKI